MLTVRVGVPLPPLTVAELKLQVGGNAVAGVTAQVRFTVELKPFDGVIVTVDVAEPPGVMAVGDRVVAVSANVGGTAVTVKLAVVVWNTVPKVPVMVKLKFPAGVDTVVVTGRDTLTCPLPDGTKIEAGEQKAPEGSPEQVTVTVPENPGCGFTSTV